MFDELKQVAILTDVFTIVLPSYTITNHCKNIMCFSTIRMVILQTMTIFIKHFTLLLLTLISIESFAQERTNPAKQYEELGEVSWHRNYHFAKQLAVREQKDLLILFQEVPGCATCRNYGRNVLTHPLIVETIETFFIPVVVYNNKGGRDKELLDRFKEPAWNNPVVRIVNTSGKDLIQRVSGNYSAKWLITAIIKALSVKRKNIPEFLKLLNYTLSARYNGTERTMYFKMYCFWSGEKHFGSHPGILSTEAGYMRHSEVVKVKYDQLKVSEPDLVAFAKKANCEPILNDGSYRIASKDLKYYLNQSNYQYLPLTEIQQCRVNSALGNGLSARNLLSPKQLAWLESIQNDGPKTKALWHMPFKKAWSIITGI